MVEALFLLSFSLFLSFLFSLLVALFCLGDGMKETGLSHYDRSFRSGTGKWVCLGNPAVAMALRAACSRILDTRLQTNGVAKYRNCGGPHFPQANACPVKRRARQEVKGWRPPTPPRRQWKAPQPGQVTTAEASEGEEEMLSDEVMAALLGVELGGKEIEE